MYKDFTKYEVFENGQIWSYKTNKFLKPATTKNGYQLVGLSDNEGKIKMYKVHRIVYEAVTGEPIPEGLEVNHLDENKSNNSFENLNLLTHKENTNYGTRTARATKAKINGKRSKAVGAYRNGELVMSFPSTNEAQRQGFYSSAISDCCNGKRKRHKGYTWKYI